ncbi:MAG: hypothetical protein GY705_32030 [Bacteroidetes bacterium]|nr:hypothetical protein [Bacteroidota bacterium]
MMNKPVSPCQKSLTVENEEHLIHLIRKICGITIFDHQMGKFRETICKSCKQFNFPDCKSYIESLQQQSFDSNIQEDLIAGITVGESYFFRDKAQMEHLKNELFPSLIKKRREQGSLYLRIWSAGSSDGQELYSIAIILHQLLPDLKDWKLHLLGTDINVDALSRAIKGQYTGWSFRSTDDEIRDKFFSKKKNYWQIKNSIKKLAKFSYLNLYNDNYPSFSSEINTMDLILCRNVFIYFDKPTAEVVMNKIYQSLLPGGYLLQGASDLHDLKINNFKHYFVNSTSYYLKSEVPDEHQQPDVIEEQEYSFNYESVVDKTDHTPDELNYHSHDNLPINKETPKEPIFNQVTPLEDMKEFYSSIIKLLSKDKWSEALILINKRIELGDDNSLIWQFKAKTLANLGQFEIALKAIELSIKHEPRDKHSHFISALIHMESKDLKGYEEALRRTLYLDRTFLEANYHMGLLLLSQGNQKKGILYLKTALDIAENENPFRFLHDSAGMSHGRMVAILRSEIKMYQLERDS